MDINVVISDVFLASWIYKTSSLPFLHRFNADDNYFRRILLSNDANTPSECNGHLELQQVNESQTTTNVKDNYGLSPSEKKSLIVKRLFPLIISLLMLGGAVAIRLLIPLPSSHEVVSSGNDTLNLDITYNFTTKSPT